MRGRFAMARTEDQSVISRTSRTRCQLFPHEASAFKRQRTLRLAGRSSVGTWADSPQEGGDSNSYSPPLVAADLADEIVR